MKVNLGTIEISDDERRALRAYYGRSGLATRKEIRNYVELAVGTLLSDLLHDLSVLEWERETPADEDDR